MPSDYDAEKVYVTALARRADAVALAGKLLVSNDQDVIELGCDIAAQLGPKASSLSRALGDALLRVRDSGETNSVVSSAVVEALVAMGSLGTAEALRLAKGASTSDRDNGRFEGFQTLEDLGPQAEIAIPFLLDVIGDEDSHDGPISYVSNAVGVLAAMRETVLPDLCQTIVKGVPADPKTRERRAAAAALWAIARSSYEAPQSTTCITEAALSPDPDLRRSALGAARSLGGEEALPILARGLLEDVDSDVQFSASGEIKKLGDPALPVLEQAIRSPMPSVRENGWFALSWLEKSSAKEALLRRLETSSHVPTRVEASLMAAEQFGVDDEGLKNLPAVMQSDDEYERQRAVFALDTAPAGHSLIDHILGLALADPSSLVRQKAYEIIVEKKITSSSISAPLFASIPRLRDGVGRDEQLETDARSAALALFVGSHPDRVQQVLAGGELTATLEVLEAIALGQAGAKFAYELVGLIGAKEFDVKVAARDALLSGGPSVVDHLLLRLSREDSREKIIEIVALADTNGISIPKIAQLTLSSKTQSGALAALMVLGQRFDAAISALSHVWPSTPLEAKVSAVRKLKQYGPMRGERIIAWALSVLREPDSIWSEELLASLKLDQATAKQVALVDKLEPHLRLAFLEKLALDAPEMISAAQLIPLLADASTFRSALEVIGNLPPDSTEMLELAAPALAGSDRSLEERLALARASNGFALEPRLQLWHQGLSDSSDPVRIATLNAIASATTSDLAVLRVSARGSRALLTLRTVTALVRTMLEGVSDGEVLAPAIRAYASVADPFDESVNKALESIILSSEEETASVAVLVLKTLPGGRNTLERLQAGVVGPVVARYIAKALEPPGTSYAMSPWFYGFNRDFPRLIPWPPGKFSDRVAFDPSEIGSATTTLGSFLRRLKTAAGMAGFPEPSLYAIPGGFAAAFAPERLGVPRSQRWSLGKLPLVTPNPTDYFRRLFLGTNEKYRWLVFYATPIDFAAPRTKLELNEARGWAQAGYSRLPEEVAQQPASRYGLGVLSYEFSKDDTATRTFASPLPSQPLLDQLRAIGLYEGLFSPLQLAAREN